MQRHLFLALVVLCLPLLAGADWLQFRGTTHNSATDSKLPTSFDIKEKKNVAWQADLPGRGPASPIVVKNRVIITASDGARQEKLFVLCFDADSGKELWRRQF